MTHSEPISALPVKRVCAVHDLSCFGRCALTVVIPALSACGAQVVPLPTALLSTHTGGFEREELCFVDLTEQMERILAHFDKLGLTFDAIYTGFLGSAEQIRLVERLLERFGSKDTLVMVDPVMGDDGVLYSTYTEELMRGMRRLCRYAHVMTPNLTEACFLTDLPYRNTAEMNGEERTSYLEQICEGLSRVGARGKLVLTGIPEGEDILAVYAKDTETGEHFFHRLKRLPVEYPGTGDLFSSVLLGKLLRGEPFREAVAETADYTAGVMAYSAKFDTPKRDGVALEAFLGELAGKSPEQD